jgi:DNA-binding SARP family transcriptional activator/tetratricopeptide (TPR) repeat protein
MLRLVTFGGLALESSDGSTPPRVRPQRLAILAILAAGGDRGVSRERICGLLWPDTDETRARHALRQALYALRQEIGADVIQSEPVLTLDRNALGADVMDFRAAVSAQDWPRAAALATGPFLHGFYLPSAEGFERWVEEERAALHTDSTRVLLALAKDASATGSPESAVEWWRRLTLLDPLSGRFALGYLKALAAHGDRAGALAFARAHESVVRRELEADADPDIRRLEAELRALPSPSIQRQAPRVTEARVIAPGPPNDMERSPGEGAVPDPRAKRRVPIMIAVAFTAVGAMLLTMNLWGRVSDGRSLKQPTFAVGMIREDDVPDSFRIGGVLTDMLATNLARVAGLPVLANSRLFELMLPGQDTLVAGYSEAARRAGATEILQGRLLSGPQWGLAMEMQRVDLASGMVRGAYRVAAADRYALVDSMTAAIARDLRLRSPSGSVADATTDSPIAYRLYEEGLRAYFQYDNDAARRLMQAALEEDSTFAMAAYYDALLVPPYQDVVVPRERALRLARQAPERERLRINAHLLALNMEPAAVAVAESLSTRFPDDPRSFELLAEAYWFRGDWRDATRSIERAIALDSASEPIERQNCRLCGDYYRLADTYFWWDSLAAAERLALRFQRVRPNNHGPWDILGRVAAARGDTTAVRNYYRRFYQANPVGVNAEYVVRLSILMEEYDQAEKDVQELLSSPRVDEVGEGRWFWSILLRNQGRVAEALAVARQHRSRDPDRLLEALVALDQGDARKLVAIFEPLSGRPERARPSGVQARNITWSKVKYAMALIAAGDTLRLRSLIDTVETWGQKSLYGRDRRAHHYLRGMLLVARGRDAEAAEELRQAIHSPTNGLTRINYELGRVLLRLDRPADAVSIVRAALHGGIDGSNLYVTRTELHELLAQAFDRMGERDSAAVHYGAVVRAWARSDPVFSARLARAREWLASHPRTPSSQRGSY